MNVYLEIVVGIAPRHMILVRAKEEGIPYIEEVVKGGRFYISIKEKMSKTETGEHRILVSQRKIQGNRWLRFDFMGRKFSFRRRPFFLVWTCHEPTLGELPIITGSDVLDRLVLLA